MQLTCLPAIVMTRGFRGTAFDAFKKILDDIPSSENFCIVGITVPVPDAGGNRTLQECLDWASFDRWSGLLSQRTLRAGWHFHVPMIGPMAQSSPFSLAPKTPEMQEAYAALGTTIDRETTDHSHHLHDIGARRRRAAEARAGTAFAYALGVRNILPSAAAASAA